MSNDKKIKYLCIALVAILLAAQVLLVLNQKPKEPAVQDPPASQPEEVLPYYPPVSDTVVSPTEPPEEIIPPDSFTVQLGGDVLIHRTIYSQAQTSSNTYDFTPYFSEFRDVLVADLNIVNLEAPVDVIGGNKYIESYPVFNMPYEILTALKGINVNLCTTATNHSIDKGYSGVVKTLENISSAGLEQVGMNATKEDASQLCIKEINGIKVGILSYTTYSNGSVSNDKKFCVNECGKGSDKIISNISPQVQRLRDEGAEFIMAAIHWGEEYATTQSSSQETAARALCEAGVDVIIGSHTHCVQPIEMITVERDGKEYRSLVIYSLGNFFINQVALNRPITQESMVVSVKAERDKEGIVRIKDAFYMPIFSYVNGSEGKDYIRLICSGEFASTAQRPGFFKNDEHWTLCKNAWDNVRKIAGDAIPCISDPSEYPEGFFS